MYRWVEEPHIWRENTGQRRGWILFVRCRRETPYVDSHTDTQKPHRLTAIWADMLHTQSDSHCPAGHTNRMDWPNGRWVMSPGLFPSKTPFSHSISSLNLNRTPSTGSGGGSQGADCSVVGKMGSAQSLNNSAPHTHSKTFWAQTPSDSQPQRGARTPFSSLRPPFPGRPSHRSVYARLPGAVADQGEDSPLNPDLQTVRSY